MIQIRNSSILCELITSYNIKAFIELQNYLAINGISATFSGVSVSLKEIPIPYQKKPAKALIACCCGLCMYPNIVNIKIKNNMNTEERLKKIADARKKMDLAQLSKEEQERKNIAEYCEKFRKHSDRIKAMILVAESLCKNNIPLGKLRRTYVMGLPEHEFCSDSISHNFGFVTKYPFTESKNIDIIGIGHVGGGRCGTDFILYPDGQVKYSEYYCSRDSHNKYNKRFDFEAMEQRLLDFEKKFYEYVDNL